MNRYSFQADTHTYIVHVYHCECSSTVVNMREETNATEGEQINCKGVHLHYSTIRRKTTIMIVSLQNDEKLGKLIRYHQAQNK